MKTKLHFILAAILLFTITTQAQFTDWYNLSTDTFYTPASGSSGGSTVTYGGITNPATGGINTFATTNQFETGEVTNSFILFNIDNAPITDVTTAIVKVKVYFEEFDDLPSTKLRLYLRELASGTTNQKYIEQQMLEVNEGVWVEYTFDFSTAVGPFNTEYDNYALFFCPDSDANGTFLWDAISGNSDQSPSLPAMTPVASLDPSNIWYHDYASNTFNATQSGVATGTFTTDETSPETVRNSSANVSKFVKTEGAHSLLTFTLPGEISDLSSTIMKFRMYAVDNATPSEVNTVKIILRHAASGASGQIALTASVAFTDDWIEYTFDFTSLSLGAGIPFYDLALIAFAQPDTGLEATGNTYYIDAFQGPAGETASVEDIATNSDISIFPTVVSSSFKISEQIQTATIYNVSGQAVKTYNNQNEYEVSDLTSGIYLVEVELPNGAKQTLRFVKN